MNIAQFSIKNKLIIYVLTIIAIVYGVITYQEMGKLEDPEFTIKDALIITQYPGASAVEVEKEVSNKIEEALQELPFVKEIESKSSTGQSIITVSMKDKYNAKTLPQIWDMLRKKIIDIKPYLPPRSSTPIVRDDFGDVYGVVYAIYGDEYSYDELKDYVDFLKKELILVEGVGKVDTFGEQQRAIFIEFKNDKLSQLGITKEEILQELYRKNLIPNFGKVNIGNEYIAIKSNSKINSVESLGNIIIKGQQSNSQIFLKDLADIKDGYKQPSSNMLEYDGHKAIAIGISTISGGNVVAMGEKLDKRLEELNPKKPLGIHLGIISHQAHSVDKAINSFIINLLQAVVIVIIVLLVFMGLRSGLIIGFVLFVTILTSFIFMPMFEIMLERISLGALIIALGMLVDNAIVVVDGILNRIKKGMDKTKAAIEVVKQTAMPLFAATAVAILAFGAIGLSQDATGEYTRSLFLVIFISLSLSWITAMTLTPILAIQFLKEPKNKSEKQQYDSMLYKIYGAILKFSINHRYLIVFIAIVIFTTALINFKHIKQNFFPDSSRPQIMVDYKLPQGTSIETTNRYMGEITKDIKKLTGVEHISTFIGSGGPRFLLTYGPEQANSAYAQMLVDIDDYEKADRIIEQIENKTKQNYPNINVFAKKFLLGPGAGGKVQVKILGDNLDKIRVYEQKILDIFRDEPFAKGIRSDWGNRVKVIKPIISDTKANLNGITRDNIANAILDTFEGRSIGVYREDTQLIPIIVRSSKKEREDIKNIQNIQIFSPVGNKMIPLRQLIESFEIQWSDDIIYKYDRKRALTIHAEPTSGVLSSQLLAKVKEKIENLEYENGYSIQWHGEYKSSRDGRQPIIDLLPLFGGLMFLIVLALFNSLKKTMIIWLTVPFALIGVVVGLLLMDTAFGFMSLLGFLSLSGMLIKNAIVLIDEITLEHEVNKKPLNEAIYHSGLNRLMAVTMAALTTALGMLPLVPDVFFGSMAIVIIFGLVVATMLTMILVPVYYAIFFKSEKLI
jgi:multidrug efflux pump subunit AcrB